MRHQLLRLLTLGLAIAAFATACGSNTDAVVSGEPADEGAEAGSNGEPEAQTVGLPLSIPISEADIAQARIQLDLARQQWESVQPFAHTLTIGDQVEWAVEIDFDEEGNVIEAREISSFMAGFIDERSVADVFDSIDVAITDFETGVLPVPAPAECGNHFNAYFNDELGTPVYFDRLGPCEDGIGFRYEVKPLSE